MVLDVSSFRNLLGKNFLVYHTILKVWEKAVRNWENAMENKLKKTIGAKGSSKRRSKKNDTLDDTRRPLFLVIDEAHNFITENAKDPWKAQFGRSHQLPLQS